MHAMPIDWKRIREAAGPYPQQAFEFVREGLTHTVELVHGDASPDADSDESRHVTGQQLCFGLKDLAERRYGRLARTVLNRWAIRRTDDFGRIIFSMIEFGLMRKTDEDHIEHFHDVYDFDEVFEDLPTPVTVRPISPTTRASIAAPDAC